MTVDEFIQMLYRDPAAVGRQIRFFIGLIVGLTFLIFGIYISRPRLYVLAGPAKAVGKITGYVRRSGFVWNASHTSQTTVTGYHPTVEFQAGAQLFRFEDWRSSQRFAPVNSPVPVLYDSSDPSKAMIDRSFWNFIPWAPITVIGFLSFLYALMHWPSRRAQPDG